MALFTRLILSAMVYDREHCDLFICAGQLGSWQLRILEAEGALTSHYSLSSRRHSTGRHRPVVARDFPCAAGEWFIPVRICPPLPLHWTHVECSSAVECALCAGVSCYPVGALCSTKQNDMCIACPLAHFNTESTTDIRNIMVKSRWIETSWSNT